MGEQEKTSYKLYAAWRNENSIREAGKFRFSRMNSKYVLVYSHTRPEFPCAEIGSREAYRLTEAETVWLFDCNAILLHEEMERNESRIAESMGEKLEMLEAALARERLKLAGRGSYVSE